MAVETLSKDAIVADLMKAIRVAFPAVRDSSGLYSIRLGDTGSGILF
jgi:hypothetical protein